MKTLKDSLGKEIAILLIGIKDKGEGFYLDAFATKEVKNERELNQLLGFMILRKEIQQNVFLALIKEVENEEEKKREYWEKKISKIKSLDELSQLKEQTLATF